MKSKYLIFFMSLYFLAGCTATHSVYLTEKPQKPYVLNIEEFNKKMNKLQLTVIMSDGRKFPAYNVLLRLDSTSFTNTVDSIQISVPTSAVNSFEDKNHTLGGIQGIFLGTLGGFVIIGGTAYLIDPPHNREDFKAAWYGIGGSIIGGVGGLIYGTIQGYTDVYELKTTSEK